MQAWRPASTCSRTNSCTSSRRASGLTVVFTGVRPGGRSRITDTSSPPYSVSCSVRGIGVAVITRMSGRSPFSRSRARCTTPNRCCSSTIDEAEARERDVLLDQRVGADHEVDAARRRGPASVGAPRGCRRGSRSADPRGSACPDSHRATVPRCCSARISVGAISATCRPFSSATSAGHHRHRGLARPDVALQQPVHRPGLLHVLDDVPQRRSLARGEPERQHRADGAANAVVHDRDERLHLLVGRAAGARRRRTGTGRTPRRSAAAAPACGRRSAARAGVPGGGKCASRSAVRRSGKPRRAQQRPRAAGPRRLAACGRAGRAPAHAACGSSSGRSSRRPGRCPVPPASRGLILVEDLDVRAAQLQHAAEPGDRPVQDHALVRAERVLAVGLIGPDGEQAAGRVAHHRLEDLEAAPAGPPQAAVEQLARDGDRLALPERRPTGWNDERSS